MLDRPLKTLLIAGAVEPFPGTVPAPGLGLVALQLSSRSVSQSVDLSLPRGVLHADVLRDAMALPDC